MNIGVQQSTEASRRTPVLHDGRPLQLSKRSWKRPTFGEFVERVRHEFGPAADLTALQAAGFGRSEPLNPEDIEELCVQLGVPAEDFGVGP